MAKKAKKKTKVKSRSLEQSTLELDESVWKALDTLIKVAARIEQRARTKVGRRKAKRHR